MSFLQDTLLPDICQPIEIDISVTSNVYGRPADDGGEAAGLSTPHISPQLPLTLRFHSMDRFQFDWAIGPSNQIVHVSRDVPIFHVDPSIEFVDGGRLATVTVEHVRCQAAVQPRGIRGKITDFSKNSRRRLMRMVASLKRGLKPVFITLTYPGEFPREDVYREELVRDESDVDGELGHFEYTLWRTPAQQWKKHLDTWLKRLHRKFPEAGAIWRLEMQKRGAPHYHLLVWGCGQSAFRLRKWVAESWFEVVGSGDTRHLQAGVRVEAIKSERGTMSYAAKYMSKPTSERERDYMVANGWANPGRFWGVMAAENLPFGEVLKLPLHPNQAIILLEAMLAEAGLPEGYWHKLTVFMDDTKLVGFLVSLDDQIGVQEGGTLSVLEVEVSNGDPV